MKGQILKILKAKAGIVSGQDLSDKLGISRVAIWKHIQKLQALGYNILATPKGYRLDNSPDVPYPWEFPGRESKIFYYPELPSTMDAATAFHHGCGQRPGPKRLPAFYDCHCRTPD
jgi:BirA family biotin operon repressor/biotin-[acetyl-CoA-carboxylase] ligase